MRLRLAVAFVLITNTANADCRQLQCFSWFTSNFDQCEKSTTPKSTGDSDFLKINLIINSISLNEDCSSKISVDGEDAKKLAIKHLKIPQCLIFSRTEGSLITVVVKRLKDGGNWSLYCPPKNF